MSKSEIRREALERQGTIIHSKGRRFQIEGNHDRAVFRFGGEGLVHVATELGSGVKYRIKCFWEPSDKRQKRSAMLVQQQLADLEKTVADALGGAPFELLARLGAYTPFAVVMKDVKGYSWKDLKEKARLDRRYPPAQWPSLEVRAIWAYGLATAVRNMEARGLIHADLSDGNVMVTPAGQHSGDMALVDFDSFVHPRFPELDSSCQGTPGYAAPEIWRSSSVAVGSDRVGMAILIQEFLVYGDPALSSDDADAFLNGYDEEADICSRRGDVFPYFASQYPELAALLQRTLRAAEPRARPEAELWRPYLRSLALGTPPRKRMHSVVLEPHPVAKPQLHVPFGDTQATLDLLSTAYSIRARIERNKDGSLDAVVQTGGVVRAQPPGGSGWKTHGAGERIALVPNTVLFDPDRGKSCVRIRGQES